MSLRKYSRQTRSMNGFLIGLLLALVTSQVKGQGDSVTLHVWENQQAPTYLGNLATLANITSAVGQGELTSLRYTLVERVEATTPLFRVDANTGDVFATSVLDREVICDPVSSSDSCLIQLDVAVQSQTTAFFRKIAVNIRVHDLNDNAPEFAESRAERSVSESASPGFSVPLPAATDRDAPGNNSRISYALSTDTVPFSLRMSTAQPQSLELVLTSQLDRESRDQYSFNVIARDGGSPSLNATLPVLIRVEDSNDNAPAFEQSDYSAILTETAAVNSPVVKVVARDLDLGENARVTYTLSEPVSLDVGALFAIDPDNGQVRVQSSLENEGGNVFRFGVKAEDHGTPPRLGTASVTVSVLDTRNDAPRVNVKLLFSQDGAATVPEGAAVGRVAALVSVTDRDQGENGRVNCTLTSGDFALQRLDDTELKVVVATALDREVTPRYNVTVTCRDFGSPPLSAQANVIIKVLDENDNSPTFDQTSYRLSVSENMPMATVVGTLVARDADEGQNAAIIYGLSPEAREYFMMDTNGQLLTRQPLNREDTPFFSFNVTARDNGTSPRSAQTSVTVEVKDVNDVAPIFRNTPYHFRVFENASSGYVIGRVEADDPDSGQGGVVRFFAEPASSGKPLPFSVQANGTIVVSEELDYERTRVYEFFATASDGGTPSMYSSASVVVTVLDVNDNSPEIYFPAPGNDSIAVPHQMARGEAIARVVADDRDSGENGHLRFVLMSKNESDMFRIDPDSGIVSTGRDLTVNDVGRYAVILNVVDNGEPERSTQAVMVIDVFEDKAALTGGNNGSANMTIVIIMVAATVTLAIIVTFTVCYLRHSDRRYVQKPGSEAKPVPEKKPAEVTVLFVSKDSNKLIAPESSESRPVNGLESPRPPKKSVSFMHENEMYCERKPPVCESLSDSRSSQPPQRPTQRQSLRGGCSVIASPAMYPQLDKVSSVHSDGNAGPWRTGSDVTGPWRQETEGVGGEISVTAALRQHRALVHSVRHSSGGQGLRPEGHDPEVWSATSGETTNSDSGHGGSDLDIHCVKVAV